MKRFSIFALGACVASAAVAAPEYQSWKTMNFGGKDSRTGAMACTYEYPHTPCMQFGCGRGQSIVLSFTELGNTPDMKDNPAGPAKTELTLRFPDGASFKLPAKRVAVKGKGFNQVEVRGWDDPRVVAAFKALGDGDDTRRITASLPDGRSTAFSTRYIGFAMGQAPGLCAR